MNKNVSDTILEMIDLLVALSVRDEIKFEDFINKLIEILGIIVPTDSCLIYFYDSAKEQLTLIGSTFPKKELIGKLSLKSNEGITGWVASHMESVALNKQAYKDPRFKVIPQLLEDKFEAFLSIPIIGKNEVLGVINLQNQTPKKFTKHDIRIVEGVCKIIATGFRKVILSEKIVDLEQEISNRKHIEKAKGLLMLHKKLSEQKAYQLLRTEAMKRRKSMKEIADAIILFYSFE